MRRSAVLVLALALMAALPMSASANPPSPGHEAGHEILGVVPTHQGATKTSSSGSNLVYHYGPVVHNDKTYAIYWDPSGYTMSTSYRSLIDGFLGNVATANRAGSTQDTYYNDTLLNDTTVGPVSFTGSSFVASVLDTSAFPASGCSDSVAATSICLSDAQLTQKIDSVVQAQGWPRDGNTIVFMFTPRGVGSCYSSSSCAFSSYCAYHSNFTSSAGGTVLYANQPYTGTSPAACGSGQSPNGDADADSTINVTSHEHNEAITDPLGSAWFDRRGYEDADKCAWTFGTALGSTGTGQYNQSINGGKYYLQRNWSNGTARCVLTGT